MQRASLANSLRHKGSEFVMLYHYCYESTANFTHRRNCSWPQATRVTTISTNSACFTNENSTRNTRLSEWPILIKNVLAHSDRHTDAIYPVWNKLVTRCHCNRLQHVFLCPSVMIWSLFKFNFVFKSLCNIQKIQVVSHYLGKYESALELIKSTLTISTPLWLSCLSFQTSEW